MLILGGLAVSQVARREQLPLHTLYRAWHNFNSYGSIHKPRDTDTESRKKLNGDDLAWLERYVNDHSTLYLDEIQQAIWFHRHQNVSASCLVRALRVRSRRQCLHISSQELGFSRKKLFPLAREADPARQAEYIVRMGKYSAEQLVFMDEVR